MGKNMTSDAPLVSPVREGRRERKRRETRSRIIEVAIGLFLARDFTSVTVDEIAEAADISKRSFFDYFPTKEDVVEGWQDRFATVLVAAVAARPSGEPTQRIIETAMMDALLATSDDQSWAVDRLVRATPSLAAREHARYLAIERRLFEVLAAREEVRDEVAARILAMTAIGALRIGVEIWRDRGSLTADQLPAYSQDMFQRLWDELALLSVAPTSPSHG